MLKPLLLTAALCTTMLLQACAPSTAMGVRELGPDRRYEFVAPEDYQPVYRKVLEQARKCYQMGLITAQVVVQGDLFQDIKSGTVTVELRGGLGVETYTVIDVQAIDDHSTKVTGHFAKENPQRMGKVLRQWVLANSKECDLRAEKAPL